MTTTIRTLLPSSLLLLCAASAIGQSCSGVDQHWTTARRNLYASQIATQSPGKPEVSKIHLSRYMQANDWVAVFAVPPDAERGVFFFHLTHGRPVYADTWGGVAGPDSVESIAAWTKTLHPDFPATLGQCFAEAVKAGD